MRCGQCQTDNLSDAAFCTECGAPLRLRCPGCGQDNAPAGKFCRGCGRALGGLTIASLSARTGAPESYTPPHLIEKVLTSRSALEGERKQVTILFVDVKGSLELARQVDPEQWHRIMDRFFAIVTAGVHRYEGTVNQYTGDGVMALFGAPIAHEDHAQRACLVALQLRDDLRRYGRALRREHGFDFAVRMGLNSGAVVVGTIGPGLRMDYTAQGETVGLAARMQQIAEAGGVYLTEHTAALVMGFFELESLGTFDLHSVSTPVRAFALRGPGTVRTRLDLSRTRGFSTFVGRVSEMAALDAALERVRGGHPAVIAVTGDPGVGKSRLCLEFVEQCRAQDIAVHEAHCPAHGRAIPFILLRELLRSALGVDEAMGDAEARRRIAGALVLRDPRVHDALPVVLDVLGLPDAERPTPSLPPEARREVVIALACRLVRARTTHEPVVVLIDDLQWSDAESEHFVDCLVEAVVDTPTLLVVNFRSDYRAPWMGRAAASSAVAYRQLPLAPPDPAAVRALLGALLGEHPSLGELPERILERTEGNPFFIEELVRALVEEGALTSAASGPGPGDSAGARMAPPYALVKPVRDIQIPATVQAVIAARVDRLGDRDKQVLQAAAVVGKTFERPILERILPLSAEELTASLDLLRHAALIEGDPLAFERGYAFRHPLVQEVQYHTQLADRRARLHAAVARALEEWHADALGQHAALIAHHYEAASYRSAAARWRRRAMLRVTHIQIPRRPPKSS
jgi:class 3 adenylate cyclase